MKFNYLKLLLFFKFILFVSCEYEFSEDYYNEIQIAEPSFSLSLTNFTDGEIIRNTKNIEYSYNATNQNELYEILFYLDDVLIESSSNSSGSILLDIENLPDNEYNLRIEYYFKTSSGSLAELSGLEYFYEIENFSFNVDKTALALEIERIEHKDGTIFIHFEDYPLVEEIEQSLNSSLLIYNDSNNLVGELILTKETIQNGVLNDNISLDTNLKYKTKVENSFGVVVESKIKEIIIPNTFNITVTSTENGGFNFKWTDHPLRSNIKSALMVYDKYGFRKNIGLNFDNNELIYNPTFDNFVFGRNYEYRLELTANNNSLSVYQTPRMNIEGEFFRGEKFDVNNYKKFLYNELNDKLFALSIDENGSVYIDELNSNSLLLVKRNFITNSNNSIGDFHFNSAKNFIVDLNSKSIEINKETFTIINEYNISEFDNSALTPNTIVRYRENTFVIDSIETSVMVTIFDIPTKTLILQKQKAYSYAFNISDSGNYFNIENKIYRKDNTILSEVYSDEFNRELYTDFDIETNKVYLAAGYVREVNLFNSSLNQISNLSNMDRVDFLKSQNKILSMHSGNYLVFYDLNTNQENRKTIEIQDNDYFYLAEKDFLISTLGYVIKNYQ